MNTKQKAEAWLVKTIDVTDLSDEISRELTDAQEIITALLAEREAFESRIAELEKPSSNATTNRGGVK